MDVGEEYSIYISARPWLKFPRKRHLARGGIPWGKSAPTWRRRRTRFVGVYHCDAAIAEGYKFVFVQRVELFISSLTAAVSKDMATLPIAHTWPGYQAGKGRVIMSSIKPERSSTRSSTEETGMSSA